MKVTDFFGRQIKQIQQGGCPVLYKKIILTLQYFFRLFLCIPGVPVALFIRLINPWLLIRLGLLRSASIGHFAANTELYLCEQAAGINKPKRRHVDLFYLEKPICNQQLVNMWMRVIQIWPAWLLEPIHKANRLIPWGSVHEIGTNTQHDRDVHNLLDRFPSHLQFTDEEEARGKAGLNEMGLSLDIPFVCLTVRDSAYLAAHRKGMDFGYHNYRDSDVQNYVLAAKELADRGYYVIRMGVKVREAMKTKHHRVIDYATNGMRSDFMDIYLGSKCCFCISVGTGFDAVPLIFRRPIVYVNMVPFGYLFTFVQHFLGITKHHFSVKLNRELTLSEIFTYDVGFSLLTSDYESKGVELIENTPEEIRDVVIEMAERLSGAWKAHEEDDTLQKLFWEIFPTDVVDACQGLPLHGEIRTRFGAAFLRNNRDWLQ